MDSSEHGHFLRNLAISPSPLPPPSLPPSLEKQLDTLEAVELWIQVNMAIS